MKHALPKATARFLQVFADQSATSGSMLLQPVAPACTGWVPGAMDELNQQDKPGVLAAVTAAADQVVNTYRAISLLYFLLERCTFRT